MKAKFIFLHTHNSTNNFATEFISKNSPSDVYCIYTYNQTDGKGQIGRKWLSEPDKNLTFSLIIPLKQFSISRQYAMNKQIALTLQTSIKDLTGCNVSIKWPNDIYINNLKTCGILIQNILFEKQIKYVIIGVGLNVYQKTFDISLPNPTSLTLENKQISEPLTKILFKIVGDLIEQDYYPSLLKTNQIENEYNKCLYKRNTMTWFENQGNLFEGSIQKVNEKGQLVIKIEGKNTPFNFGELKWL